MSYDFFLFEPEATQPLTSLILSDNAHLNARYEAENTTTTTQLRQACARINHDSIQLASLDDPIMIEGAEVLGDRIIEVTTLYDCA